MTLDYGPPNPRPKPKERPTPGCPCESCTGRPAYETKYMNSRLRDDSNFWMGVWFGWSSLTLAIVVVMVLVFSLV